MASESRRLNPNGTTRELIRFVPAHGYIALDKVADYMQTVLFEIPLAFDGIAKVNQVIAAKAK